MTTTSQTDKKLEASWATFVTLFAKHPFFRKSQVADFLVESLSGPRRPTPEQRTVAAKAADRFMAEARKAEKLVKAGHIHWRFAGVQSQTRTLIDGRVAAEAPETRRLVVESRCPTKWLSVDLETGDVWQADETGRWKSATAETMAALKLVVDKQSARKGN
ncbi:hypothetical protein BLA39750_01041 [Burkholderia lata]|uniref:Uncharacterized protein n=1 Tax=Burkholderia lata (strain ATCC 17760 / DSM 23089 / LMG 22485 / NCIMB 9086 / R18194 / 383) TaxID=482957 RepID=A0A6P2V5N9_BURL3|nr:hypothetical protein [Burkholderia lata]VWC78742.1 hypothetical protein BLA39750_01041 [Burkholderia lata]